VPSIRFLLKVSRPRFWIYLLGPYVVGLAAGTSQRPDLFDFRYLVFGIYFTLPANLLVYGINDICDYETDRRNPKKASYEALVTPERQGAVLAAIMAINLPFLAGLIDVPLSAINALITFLFLSIFYSAPPIRAKTKPFLDSAFNVLYIMPGVFGYALISGSFPPAKVVLAGGLWTAAMHAYSAIPDIRADREAGISTIATFCGANPTILLCAALYGTSALLAAEYLGSVSVPLGVAYLLLMLVSLYSARQQRLFQLYQAFPIINLAAGFIIFLCAASGKLP
jgi:4-hydroxybenzoate polyprenyltransferase